jgi:hypothetical protein
MTAVPRGVFQGELLERNWVRRHSLLADKVYEKFALWRWIRQLGADRFAWVEAQQRLDWKNDHAAFWNWRTSRSTTGVRRGLKSRGGPVDHELTRLEQHARRTGFA